MIDQNVRLLSICSSKNRPHRVKEMIESFYATKSPGSELLVYISEDDTRFDEYKEVLKNVNYTVGKNMSMCEVLNYVSCELFPDRAYYQEVNDDHIYRTPSWDQIMISAIEGMGGWGMAYGYTQNLPGAVVLSGNIVRTLGYFVHPNFRHLYLDNYLYELSGGIGRIIHLPQVMIEHMHAHFGKAAGDEVYRNVYSEEQHKIGADAYNRWVAEYKVRDIQRVMEAMEKAKHAQI